MKMDDERTSSGTNSHVLQEPIKITITGSCIILLYMQKCNLCSLSCRVPVSQKLIIEEIELSNDIDINE